jgi:hypothetical protein
MTFNSQMGVNKIVKANVESFWWMIIQDFKYIFQNSICKLKNLSNFYVTSQDALQQNAS